MNSPCKIGVDGGGTKTELILVDAAGAVLARHTAPGCNPNLAGPDRARATLRDALDALRARAAAPVTATLLCMAGSRTFWRETAAGLAGCGRVTASDDSLPVLELATGGAPGLALHAGTGSFVAARAPDGSLHYAGGLGWRFGDPASGHDLGRRGIARALLELQGWPPRTALAAALAEHTGCPDYAANSRLFYAAENAAEANARIAAFAPRVLALAAEGCAPAREAVAASLAELADLASHVLRRLFPAPEFASARSRFPFGLSGPLLTHPAALAILRDLAAARAWPAAPFPIVDPPIEGVHRLLLKIPAASPPPA